MKRTHEVFIERLAEILRRVVKKIRANH